MPIIRAYHPRKTEESYEQAKNTLFWYDPERKKRMDFLGSRLEFSYQFDSELKKTRLMPKVVEEKVKTKTSKIDPQFLYQWFRKYQNYNSTEAEIVGSNSTYVEFSVPRDEAKEFSYDLERAGIRTD